MSLFSRLRDIASRLTSTQQRIEKAETELPRNTGEQIRELFTPQPRTIEPVGNSPANAHSDISELGGWESGLYADYVPETLWNDRELLRHFDVGFGQGMSGHSYGVVRQARIDFLRDLQDEGIFIDETEFWDDWRDYYESTG